SVPDSVDQIEEVTARAMDRAEVVITTGGLGVTADDRTKQAVARLLGRKLVLDEDVLERVRAWYESRNRTMPEAGVAMAMLPEGGRPIDNQRGTAPGLLFEKGEGLLFVLPGVPAELRAMFDNYVSPFLEGRGLKPLAQERLIRTTGLPESEIAEIVGELGRRLARTDVAYLPSVTGVDLKVIGRGQTPLEAEKTAESSQSKIAAKLEPYVYARGDESLEKVVGYLLSMGDATLSVAESCTGGRLGWRMTRVPGSSDYFKGGVIVYSNELKKRLVGVKAGTLKKHGAVSSETAIEMATGVRTKCATDWGLAITGVAGPGGGTADKPVGTVFVAVAGDRGDRVRELHLEGGRGSIRRAAVQAALELLRRSLLNIKEPR
ncbi:MAG TPA: CinA family nicotinamide mononucleotide deamidase-related protein, partial [bacterium]|nr:CinA family nicotinamide mononucleotide deamidase-related protein [bacterium]